ncbi:class I SAM-dependent RNA methyltransferase [Skermanella mucosa]|uniref:class I SAM-dependent RNA methyltransferase n=1 Tax=Skermanella mucosa TaxID=1789672 RepID=UPI00192B9579|nr:class I SAM-dependent RNA methyltransferase [Skermanella mucosa]UEM21253.1 class I SAM-dependent RNA methyltransferase [Skermanella mucosa]
MERRPQRRHQRKKPAPGGGAPVTLEIREIGARGDGLAEHAGRRVYVPLTVAGDRVRAALGEPRGDGVAATLLEVAEPGPDRAVPPCRHFGTCGGCALQHLEDAAYGAWKRSQVSAALARAGLAGAEVAPTVRTPAASRRRATFAAARRGGRCVLGFNERSSHRIAAVTGCLVVEPAILDLLAPLEALLCAILPDGGTADVAVAVLDGGIDLLLTGGPEPGLDAREHMAAFAETNDIGRLSWRRSATAEVEPIAARRALHARFGGVAVPVGPGAFLQASAAGEAALVEAVLAGVGPTARVADLFAGLGTFTFPLASRPVPGTAVYAVEGDAAAHGALVAAGRGRAGVTAERRDLFADPLEAEELSRFDAVVFDPPRAGARAQSVQLAASAVPTVVGVSCNPATFARDARTLVDGGYRLERVTPVDQFLWSSHVELVGVFRR